jgi:ubiquinone/menaquinone biosynthesis C-methylase UbiE
MSRPDYGLDAPPVIRNLALAAIGAAVAAMFLPWRLALFAWASGALCAFEALYMVWASRVGKVRQRERLLDAVDWSKVETVLDVGCGRGLLLIGAARRLRPGARAVGVDLWQAADLGDNRPSATIENATREGVRDRVEVVTADMRALPLATASVDVVVSSLAIHNLPDRQGRVVAIAEILRVLRPGGTVVIQDMRHVYHYATQLREFGLRDVAVSALQLRIFPPVRYLVGHQGGVRCLTVGPLGQVLVMDGSGLDAGPSPRESEQEEG